MKGCLLSNMPRRKRDLISPWPMKLLSDIVLVTHRTTCSAPELTCHLYYQDLHLEYCRTHLLVLALVPSKMLAEKEKKTKKKTRCSLLGSFSHYRD